MAKREDQIFQLSLTELAFTIAFILLLLLGYQLGVEIQKNKAAEAKFESVRSMESTIQSLNESKSQINQILAKANISNPSDTVNKLIASNEVKQERDQYKVRVEELNSQISSLTALQKLIEKAEPKAKQELVNEEIKSALSIQESARKMVVEEQAGKYKEISTKELASSVNHSLTVNRELHKLVKSELNKEINPGEETKELKNLVAAARNQLELSKNDINPINVKKENSDLRGQVAFLKNKLDARGGRDFPPCWADENGKVEFLFFVELKEDSVSLVPAWPAKRAGDADSLPGINEVLSGSPHSNRNFISSIQGIFRKSQNDQCRHYVQLKSSIVDAVQSDRARLMVENYFYKTEQRR